jgi:hypothetical protein
MLDSAISAPAVTGRLNRLAIPAAVAAGVLNAALAAVQLLAPAQPADGHHFARASDYIIEILFAASLLTTACAVLLLARYHRQLGRWGTFGTIAASAYALGTGLSGISSAATAARGVETLGVIQFPAIVLWLAVGLLMAIAATRARVLPIVVGLGFAAGPSTGDHQPTGHADGRRQGPASCLAARGAADLQARHMCTGPAKNQTSNPRARPPARQRDRMTVLHVYAVGRRDSRFHA